MNINNIYSRNQDYILLLVPLKIFSCPKMCEANLRLQVYTWSTNVTEWEFSWPLPTKKSKKEKKRKMTHSYLYSQSHIAYTQRHQNMKSSPDDNTNTSSTTIKQTVPALVCLSIHTLRMSTERYFSCQFILREDNGIRHYKASCSYPTPLSTGLHASAPY